MNRKGFAMRYVVGLSVVIGFQNVSQLRAIYGRDQAVTLTSSPTTKAILRVDETETA